MEKLIKHYDLLVESGNDPFRDPPALARYMNEWDGAPFIDLMRLSGEMRVLEIGVGTGRLAARVLGRCAQLTGIDCSPRSIERARENLPDQSKLKLLCGDFLNWQTGEKFDLVYCSLTFWHFADKRAAVEKAASLLSAGGRLVLSIGKQCDECLECFDGVRVPLYPDDPDQLQALFAEYGLCMEERRETGFAWLLSAIRR